MLDKLNLGYRWSLLQLAIIAVCGLFGCNDYLEKKSNNNLITPNTLESLQMLLDNPNDMNFNVPGYGEASSDNYFLLEATFNGLNEVNRNIYQWKVFDQIFNNDWAKGYIPIYQANLVLDQLKGIERTEINNVAYDNLKGSALFFRANQYLNLLWTYAHVYDNNTASNEYGIVLRENSDPNALSRRASMEESYNRVIADLKQGIHLLPIKSIHPMRPSKTAAYSALARTYLSMRNYEEAYTYADSALYYHTELMDYNNLEDVDIISERPFKQFNKEIIFYSELTIHSAVHPTICFVDTLLYESFEEEDLRKAAFFTVTADNYARFKGTYAASNNLFGGIALDELYLIRAESAVRIGMIVQSLHDLNTLLKSRWRLDSYVNFESDDSQVLLAKILDERRKSLMFRGLRWIDIKRLNAESPNIMLSRKINGEELVLLPGSNIFALPIPTDIIEITGIPQNVY